MNIVTIAGRLGKDPETRFTQGGQKVTSFSVATSIRRKGQEETLWWRVTVWGDRFDKMISYLKKGSAVIVNGEMNLSHYNDRDGKNQTSLEITADSLRFSPFGKSDPEGGAGQQQQRPAAQTQSFGEKTFGGEAEAAFTPAQGTEGAAAAAEEPMPF